MVKAGVDPIAERLEEALDRVNRPGDFCTFGSLPAVLPGLEVRGVGPVGLPLVGKQVETFKRELEQAPYGKGTRTLVDTRVRRVWRLTPDRFSLTNPAWPGFLDGVVARVQEGLGLERQALKAHLYDLLLYEPGSFFLPHRDGEKLDRMVATLVVVLPSKFVGGELVVRHEGEERVFDFTGPGSEFQTHFAAFYADCEHEVRPLKSGCRLCLVYNLTLAKSKKGTKPPGAPRPGEHVSEVAAVLRDWKAEGIPDKLAVLLGHRFTEGGLSWDALKGVDRARARVLAEAAKAAGFQAFLALLTYWQMGSAEEEYGGYDEYGRYHYGDEEEEGEDEDRDAGDDEGEEDGDEEGGGQYRMLEVIEESLSSDHWTAPDGDAPPFGTVPIEEEEVVPPDALKSVKPQEEFEGYTGNAGMTLDRWYRHAAVILWPDERHVDVILRGGGRQALPVLERMVAEWQAAGGADADALKKRCLTFARKVVSAWPESGFRGHAIRWEEGREGEGREDEGKAPDPLSALDRLDDPALLGRYFRVVLDRDSEIVPGRPAVKAVARHGWATFRDDLLDLFRSTDGDSIGRNVHFLEQLCRVAADDTGNREAHRTCKAAADATVAALGRIDKGDKPAEGWRPDHGGRAVMLSTLARALAEAALEDALSKLVDHVQASPNTYPLRPVQLRALALLARWLEKARVTPPPALARWVAGCRRQLESLTAAEPKPPTDLRREADFKPDCADCRELKAFLLDPRQETHSFQMPQPRRNHLEDVIERKELDLSCRTDRRPRPQVLICTKNQASYHRRLEQYHEDLEHLAAVRSMEKRLKR